MDKILINGATGKLGSAIAHYLKDDYIIISCHQRKPIYQVLDHSPNIIIDTTNAKAIHTYLPLYLQLKIPTIIATSGLSPDKAYAITEQADFPLLIVPNLSLSFQQFAAQCKILQKNARYINITETHHKNKLDSPSGTSLFLAHMLNTQCITAKRTNTYIAQHTVKFEYLYHTTSISHSITNIREFLPGIKKSISIINNIEKGCVLLSDQ